MSREKLEGKVYRNMTLLRDEKNAMEVRSMSEEEEKKQIELFKKRLQKENSRKTGKKSYRKLAAAIAIIILLPGSVYAAAHYENIKETWLQKFIFGGAKLDLSKIHDKNWGKEDQKEMVYEAFGVKLTIYSCFYDQVDDAFYVSYKIKDSNNETRVLGGDFGDNSIALAEKQEAVCISVVGVDENGKIDRLNGSSNGSISWYNSETGLTYMKLDLNEIMTKNKLKPQIVFTKRMNDNWADSLDDWKIVREKRFDMPETEYLEMRVIISKEDKTVKLKVSQQSLVLYVDNVQNKDVDITTLKNKNAVIYLKNGKFDIDGITVREAENSVGESSTKDNVFELDSSSGYYADGMEGFYSVENVYTLGGADLSKIEKIKIGKYTFEL